MNNQELSRRLLELLGGKENIVNAINCMTRLRVSLKDYEKVDLGGLKETEGVIQVIRVDNLHIVLGPGKARIVTDQFRRDAGLSGEGPVTLTWQEQKAALRARQKQSKIKVMMKTVGEIFIPMIPGVITAGLCCGFVSLIAQIVPDFEEIRWLYTLHQMLTMVYISFMGFINAWTGYRAAEKFGATPILGGMLGAITSMANINTIAELIGLGVGTGGNPMNAILHAESGGVLAVILGVLLMSGIEKRVRAKMPGTLDIVISPMVIMLATMVPYVLMIMPVTGLVSKGLASVVGVVSMSENVFIRLMTGFVSAFIYLPMVAVGMHHGLVALFTVQLETLGFVTLYPALIMAGAGQVGAAAAIWMKARRVGNTRLSGVIAGALPAGILGVGEPLIYGVTLPLGKPFFMAGLGAGFGGAFCMAMGVASGTWEPSGILAIPIMTAGSNPATVQMAYYAIGLVISYIMGFVCTYCTLKDNDVEGV